MINFQTLYKSNAPDVYRFALWLCGDLSEAEDITSETFTRAWVHNSKIRTETLKAYLFKIARNIYLQNLRKRKYHTVLDDVYPDPAPGPDKRNESYRKLQEVRIIIQVLPEIDRSAFILRVQYELSYQEIARVLHISLASAKVKVYRVRKKLVEIFLNEEAIDHGNNQECDP